MINNYLPVSSSTAANGTVQKNSQATTTSADILSSFQEIFSSMMMTSGMSSSNSQSNSGSTDLMGPMMMMMLFEKIMAMQLEQGTPEASTSQSAADVASRQTTKNISQFSVNEPSGRPVEGILTQNFHPGHNGLDFGVVVGTPIKSTMDGKVTYAGWNDQGYGNLVIVENGPYRTYFGHLSSIPVAVGDSVSAGTTIGLSGNTGHSTGPHLHYEIRKNNIPIDPTSVTLGVSG